MGGKAAAKGFAYQDLCALYRVVSLYETGTEQTVQVEDSRAPAGDRSEPWDIKIHNPTAPLPGFRTELWQAKDTAVSKNQCCVFWKNLHRHVHPGEIHVAAKADIKQDMLLGVITSSSLHRDLERFRQFLECLRDYDHLPDCHEMEEAWREDYKGVDLDSFARQLTADTVNTLAMLDFTSRSNGSVFWFRRFIVEEWKSSALKDRIENLCGKRLGTHLDDSAMGFSDLCGGALEWIRTHYGKPVPFEELISLITRNERRRTPKRRIIRDILEGQRALVGPLEGSDQPPLSQMFVEPSFELNPAHKERAKNPGRQEKAREWLCASLRGAGSEHGLQLVLGDFGHGKTSLLKMVAADLATNWQTDEAVPVFVPLRRCAEEYEHIQDLVAEAVSNLASLDDDTWRSSKWLVLCDGFDELNAVHQDRPDWVRSRFLKLCAASLKKNIRVVISARPILFMDTTARAIQLKEFHRIHLLPFDSSQVKQWLKNWNGALTFGELKKRGLDEIVATPVILSLVAQLKQARGLSEDRYTRAGIFKEFFEWVRTTGGALEAGEFLPKHEAISMNVLRKIAVHLFCHPEAQAGMMRVPVLLDEVKREFKDSGEAFDARLFVRHAFHEGKADYVEFLHQSLREYLVADYFVRCLFYENEDGEWNFSPDLTAMMIDRPLTLAKIQLFREIVEGLVEETNRELLEPMTDLHWWPTVLKDMIEDSARLASRKDAGEEAACILAHAWFSKRSANGAITREQRFFQPNVALGNAVLLHYLAQLYYTQMALATDPNRMEGLLGLIRFLSSDQALEPLLLVLRKSLGGLAFETETEVTSIDFSLFEFYKNTFNGLWFKNCVFKWTQFVGCSFESCHFMNCHFESANWTGSSFRSVRFVGCRFADVMNEGSPSSGVRYVHCVMPSDGGRLLGLTTDLKEAVFSSSTE